MRTSMREAEEQKIRSMDELLQKQDKALRNLETTVDRIQRDEEIATLQKRVAQYENFNRVKTLRDAAENIDAGVEPITTPRIPYEKLVSGNLTQAEKKAVTSGQFIALPNAPPPSLPKESEGWVTIENDRLALGRSALTPEEREAVASGKFLISRA